MTAKPRITIDTVRATTPIRPIGLGADLTQKSAIPSEGSSLRIAALMGLGGLAFAVGVGVTLFLHRPDLLHLGSVDAPALIDLKPARIEAPQVTRNATSFMGVSPAVASTAEPSPPKQDLTSGIVLTEEQQRNIASVLALAGGERPQRPAPTLSAAAFKPTTLTNHTVAVGDTLALISTRYYGDATAYESILTANADVLGDPNRLTVGTTLVIPKR